MFSEFKAGIFQETIHFFTSLPQGSIPVTGLVVIPGYFQAIHIRAREPTKPSIFLMAGVLQIPWRNKPRFTILFIYRISISNLFEIEKTHNYWLFLTNRASRA